ncbi:MAG TPA: sensor domain-containing diguanylate cyclase [Methylophaga aminisulfidivorans]|uniref:diguanylate cyclase n=2 Tax=root TaxID=1 RepID=A0A7C2AP94_9GAMM|nr:sensor domain-containing diguanylate cyclase [Methylophaga aminisulfidivorans]HEC73994.1 sensor domain-containing diguanylate cyclase [Methylophaga aminisulfidivorans]
MKRRDFFTSTYFYGLSTAIITGFVIFKVWGEVKAFDDINWLDVMSEGGMVILAVFWLALLVRSRPAGRVTQLLALGLCGIVFSWSMDFLDEFIHLAKALPWHNWLESLPIPFSLVILSIGIYHWHQEEIAISQQMLKRERHFREHRLFDKLIPVGGAAFLRKQLKHSIAEAKQFQQPLALLAIDLDNFNEFNRRHGVEEGDHVLQLVCQLLLLQLRDEDIICRLAGDRFVILLANTTHDQAMQILHDMKGSIAAFVYRSKQTNERMSISASAAITMANESDSSSLLKQLNHELMRVKRHSEQLA